ncbi:hypothetical protein GCM10010245_82820 [Streptomyces spectabilis]|uniref:Uncharacterized protein n=1 Tax=Streptomyces spectabilis TaxID=68270 RepID=A0A7W8B2V9_STRST|nr:hypothetical protein [Streptomyces spectabilis]GGV52557.1 hypothetical protein GCM10010245_82820 [Streptomyces spectabilis]
MTASSGTSRPRLPWLLLAVTVLLAATALGMLTVPQSPSLPSAAPSRTVSALSTPAFGQKDTYAPPSFPAGSGSEAPSLPPDAAPTPVGELPPRAEGPDADRPIQQHLEQDWPRDLPVVQEQRLRAAGARLLRADATGAGRELFPGVFGRRPPHLIAPAFSRVRIQAAIARRAPGGGARRAVVHLVWAGADRGGTYLDTRVTDLYFRQPKGTDRWTALPLP